MKSDDELYQNWLEQRRSEQPGPQLTDRVMAAVTRTGVSRPAARLLLVLMWIDRSRVRCFAACTGAFFVGSGPFVYLAYLSQAFVF